MGTAIHRTISTSFANTDFAPWLSENSIEHAGAAHTMTCTIVKAYDENEHLFMEGDTQTHIYLVNSGAVALYKVLSDGRRQVCAFAYPGDIVGLDSIGEYVNSAEVLCASTVRSIPVNAIEKLMRTEPGFGEALLHATASQLAETREQMLSLGRKTATEKVATFFLRISRRNRAVSLCESTLSIPMKRCEIADYLGLTAETVSRMFTKFKNLGIIRLDKASTVQILDMQKLEAVAQGAASCAVH